MLAIKGVTIVAFGSAELIASVVEENSCVVLRVIFNDTIVLDNNVDDELSISVLLEIVLIDSALVAEDVVFIELLARDELFARTDRRLEKLSWVVIAVKLPVRYSTELRIEVTCRVGVTVTGGVVGAIVETGKIETSSVVETFATDAIGLLSGEVVTLRSILLLEVMTTVGGTLGVNAPEKRVLFTRDVADVYLSTTKVCVSSGRNKLVLTPEV